MMNDTRQGLKQSSAKRSRYLVENTRGACSPLSSFTRGGAPADLPLREEAPLRPTSPYPGSKAAGKLLAYRFFGSYGLPVLRALRRALYLLDHRYQPLPETGRRRILILGAGLSGVGIALEMVRYPHLQVVGFVDDDANKQGCLRGGHRVLGSSEKLRDLMRQNQVSDLIVCAQSMAPERLGDVREACAGLRVSVHVIPTVDQILGSGQAEPAQPARSV